MSSVMGMDETNPYPSFKVGYARFSVETTEKELSIEMTPNKAAGEHYRPGETVTYDVHILNTGVQTDTFVVSLSGHAWTTHLYSGTVELTTPIQVPACGAQDLTVEVEIPASASIDDEDTVTIAAELVRILRKEAKVI